MDEIQIMVGAISLYLLIDKVLEKLKLWQKESKTKKY